MLLPGSFVVLGIQSGHTGDFYSIHCLFHQRHNMKTSSNVIAVLLVCAFALVAPHASIAGQKNAKHHGNICLLSEDAIDKLYDGTTVNHIDGTLESIRETPIENKGHVSQQPVSIVHVMISANGRLYTIRLGPTSFLQKQDFRLRIRDFISVDFCSLINCGEEIFVAGAIKKGSRQLELRDATGKALWLVAQ